MTGVAALPALGTFQMASEAVVRYLKQSIPLGFWAVTRFDGTSQVYLTVDDDSYGLAAGDSHLWSDSFCQFMVTDETPQIAPDAMTVPEYASAGVAQQIDIGAYVGIPVRSSDGVLFGTICGLDPEIQSPSLTGHGALLGLLSQLLSSVLEAELGRVEAARAAENAHLLAETDQMTGLINRRGWQRFVELEEDRYRRFGDPCTVIVADLDRLKFINDNQGHAAGDRYIKDAARILFSTARSTDLVARLGGDEFGIIATKTTLDDAGNLLARLESELTAAGVSASLGHATYSMQVGFTGTWQAADVAMYQAKALRRTQNPDA